jgi:hypothetical protein
MILVLMTVAEDAIACTALNGVVNFIVCSVAGRVLSGQNSIYLVV